MSVVVFVAVLDSVTVLVAVFDSVAVLVVVFEKVLVFVTVVVFVLLLVSVVVSVDSSGLLQLSLKYKLISVLFEPPVVLEMMSQI